MIVCGLPLTTGLSSCPVPPTTGLNLSTVSSSTSSAVEVVAPAAITHDHERAEEGFLKQCAGGACRP